MSEPRETRVLVVEDSPSVSQFLTRAIEKAPGLRLVGTAEDGATAISLAVELEPDVISMDIHLSGDISGIDACREIMALSPTPIVMLSALSTQPEVPFESLRAGAMTILSKAKILDSADGVEHYCTQLNIFAQVKPIRLRGREDAAEVEGAGAESGPRGRPVEALGIVASTGGPPVLGEVLGRLPRHLAGPILIAVHIQPDFLLRLVQWLSEVAPVPVEPALPGVRALPGRIYLAPPQGALLVGDGGAMRFDASSPPLEVGTRLLESLAQVYGDASAGLVLTGMGSDGSEGLGAIRRAGGRTAVQAPRTCTIASMPERAAPHAQETLTIGEIPAWIGGLLGRVS